MKTELITKLAARVLSLPPGSWPETEQAEMQLAEELPPSWIADKVAARKNALLLAIRQGARLHPDRNLREEFAEEFASLPQASLNRYFAKEVA